MIATQQQFALTAEQAAAADIVGEWLAGRRHEVTFCGAAGVGKTQVLSYLYPQLAAGSSLFIAPTNKACHVLNQKGHALGHDIRAMSLHSAIYMFNGIVETDEGRELPQFADRDGLTDKTPFLPRRIVVEESSMLDANMVRDLRSKELPLLFVGDGFQLPPVGEDPRLLDDPDILLTTVHRQAADSGILRLAHRIRTQGGGITLADAADDVSVVKLGHPRAIAQRAIETGVDQIIVPFNNIRHAVNRFYRSLLGYKRALHAGDRLICRFNDHRRKIFNGQQFVVNAVTSEDDDAYYCNIQMDHSAELRGIPVQKRSLGNASYKQSERVKGTVEFDYSYAITCHASQGSSYGHVMVVDRPCRAWDMKRWRYTGLTRAEGRLTVVI